MLCSGLRMKLQLLPVPLELISQLFKIKEDIQALERLAREIHAATGLEFSLTTLVSL